MPIMDSNAARTPARLKEFANDNVMDNPQWTFLQGSVDDLLGGE